MLTNGLFSSEKDYWETPAQLFSQLDNEFHFTLDPCASDKNAKCSKFFTVEQDGLTQNWGGERVFCNPPYGREIEKWVRKAYESARERNTLVVMLLPARTDTRWFQRYILHRSEIRFLSGRVKFELDGKQMQSAPFPSMIVIFRAGGLED